MTKGGTTKTIVPDFIDGSDLIEVKGGLADIYIDDQWRAYFDILGYKYDRTTGKWVREIAPEVAQFKTLTIHVRPGVEFKGRLKDAIETISRDRVGGRPAIQVIADVIIEGD